MQNEKGTPVISATVSIDNPDEDIFLGVDAKVKIYAASAKNSGDSSCGSGQYRKRKAPSAM